MSTITHQPEIPRAAPRATQPWTELAVRASDSFRSTRPLYQGLARRLKVRPSAATSTTQLYRALGQRVDPAQYKPRRIENVAAEALYEDGQSYTVLRSPNGNYVRLSPTEAEIWRAMDGTKSVAALATMGFLRFGQLLPVAGLVQELGQQGFLSDSPTGLYRGLREQLESQRVESWGRRFLTFLRGREFAINGLDGFTTQVYRLGGRLLFNRGFVVLHGIIALIGLICFGLLLGGNYNLLDADQMAASLLALWAALLISFALHELGHALAVKHFGRRVLRGGMMIYYGMPAAFVDTSDIWMSGRRARILVSLAGPLCDLLIGSLAAIAAFLLPQGWLGAAAFRLATACYLAALFNFNPLLELDGYYMLTDGLRLPNLRRRALAFISGPLWQKLRVRADLSREERIFALYGLLAAAYTTVAVILAALFWQEQLIGVLSDLWAGGIGGRILAVLITLAQSEKIRARRGFLSGVFLVGYAAARIVGEFFREPDSFMGFLAFGATMGQLLSLPMALAGLWLILRSRAR
ncbi:MAG: hypothetical protein HC822_28335 [Oscillochloris sp.]|nr:hypothetical protein [Oscillochloris sp.]